MFRHLLREASYLPPFAQPVARERIRSRFDRHRNTKDPERLKTLLRKGNHKLRYLRAANNGDFPRMRFVLFEIFGRLGFRRRQLLHQFFAREPPADEAELEKFMQTLASQDLLNRHSDWLDRWNFEKLQAFLKSQALNPFDNSPRPSVAGKTLDPTNVVLKETIWGRPPSAKLARSRLRKWWRNMLERVMPPLPKKEWEMLRDLSLGNNETTKNPWAPPRRTVAQSSSPKEGERWDWKLYATRRVAFADIQKSRRNKLLSGAVDDTSPMGDTRAIHEGKFTPRTWRSVVGDVFMMSSYMEKKPTGDGWDIKWGKVRFEPPVANQARAEIFEGISFDDKPQAKNSIQPASRAKSGRG
ncbi:hypothetical protein B0T24DRAFT_591173 [Lasiosphaeria ovina]|uniref:Complex 1 LYR protein domain-containing protein n=1 Tax=Lasiosphaeria ovina TaxID=92902 RepID=A0AAE0NFW2_9PEZI|nr:hypothetical protein B0T24DRAFT_591173 [Lasiosphaeria ovina]